VSLNIPIVMNKKKKKKSLNKAAQGIKSQVSAISKKNSMSNQLRPRSSRASSNSSIFEQMNAFK